MSKPSRYPGFHKHVTKIYLVFIIILAACLPLLNLFTKKPNISQIIGIMVFAIILYIVYWLIVRLNCYGTPLQERRNGRNSTSSNNSNSNNNNNNIRIIQPPRSNSSSSTHSSSTNNHHPTFASYRLGGLAEIFRRIGGSNVSSTNDDEISCETGEVLRPPPPTYNTALEGAGLPPPYMNDPIEINVHNSESPQMSERYVHPRRPVPSIPSSSSLRRPTPPIIQRQSSTQSIQDTSQDPSTSDSSPRRPIPSIPQPSGRPVPSAPTSLSSTSSSLENTIQQPKRPIPPVPATSSSTSRFHKSQSLNNLNNE